MTDNFATLTVHGVHSKNPHGALAAPIYQTSTFVFESAEQGGRRFAGEEEGYIYTRLGNPTTSMLEEKVALLEKGEACAAFASGMGAISGALLTLLESGDHIVADKTLYGCTFSLMNHGLRKFGVEVDFVDCSNLEEVAAALRENTKIVYLETPANPNLKIIDIEEVAKLAHEKNENCYVIVDNTFSTPYITNPLELGANIVVHSATKYLNGHGDVIAGFVISDRETINRVKGEGLKDFTGAALSPFDAFLILRGLKTLKVRMDIHCENAMKIAHFLKEHSAVEKVYFPGLKDHPDYAIAEKQMKKFGAVMAFEVKGGLEAGKKLLNSLKLCVLAVSLGDAETLIQHPASMTHSAYDRAEREKAGITDGLIRLSVGIEEADDIIADLKQALDSIIC